ncbi:MAG: hypothetical protein QOI04_194 [Verrucomicrobiota bacterium]
MTLSKFLFVLCAAFALLVSPITKADVVYSTIDPTTTTYTFSSGFISYPILNHPPGSPPGVYQSYADQFSPTVDFVLSSISFGVRTIGSGTFGDLNAIIYLNDPNTNLPLTATPLASSTAVAPFGTSAAQTVPLTVFDFSAASLTLFAGQLYWVALEPGRDGTDVDWGFTTNNTRGRVAENFGSGYHQYTVGGNDPTPAFGAFRINAVPEPSVSSLLGYCGLGISTLWLKRRLGRHFSTKLPQLQ